MKVDEQVDHFARRVELVAAVAGESINEASGADATESGRGDLHWSVPAVGTKRAGVSGCGARDEHRVGYRPGALVSRQAGFARLAEEVATALAGPAQCDAVAVGGHLHRVNRAPKKTSELRGAELTVLPQPGDLLACPGSGQSSLAW